MSKILSKIKIGVNSLQNRNLWNKESSSDSDESSESSNEDSSSSENFDSKLNENSLSESDEGSSELELDDNHYYYSDNG